MRGLHAKCDCDGRRPHGTGKFARRVAGKGESAKREGDSDRDMERITGKKTYRRLWIHDYVKAAFSDSSTRVTTG